MKKLLFILSLCSSFSLNAISCFGSGAPKEAPAAAVVKAKPQRFISKAAFVTSDTTDTNAALTPVDGPVAAGVGANFIEYSHDGRFAAVVNFGSETANSTISVYSVDCESGAFTLIQTVDLGANTRLTMFAYSPCDNFAAVADIAGNIFVFSVSCTTGEWSLIQTIPDPNLPQSIDYSPDGRFVMVGTAAGTIETYRVSPISGKLILVATTTAFSNTGVPDVKFSPNGKFVAATTDGAGNVAVFSIDPVTGELTFVSALNVGCNILALAWQHDGNFLAVTGSGCQSVFVISVNPVTGTLTLEQTINTTSSNPSPAFIAFSSDDSLALVGSLANPGSAVVFCVTDGTWCTTPIQTLPPAAGPRGVAFAPCEDNAAIATFGDGINPGSVQVFEVNDDVCPVCP